MLDFRWRSLESWPRPFTKGRRALEGEQAYDVLLRRLDYELGKLRAKNVVIQTAHRPEDIRQDQRPRSGARLPSHPGVVISFDAQISFGGKPVGPLSYACDTYRHWQDNIRAIVLTLEALRAVDRYGASTSGEQYRGWAALPAPGVVSTDSRRAAALLLLKASGVDYACQETATAQVLNDPTFRDSVIRKALKYAHPDTGGNAREFQEVQQAREVLIK